MASKLETLSELTTDKAEHLTASYQEWTAFLTTAARLYKYPFLEQVMIYAQRPEATACADYDVWNRRMRRYIRRGSSGIALIDLSGGNPTLRYVFDISDTGGDKNAITPYIWQYRGDHQQAVMEALETRYGVPAADGIDEQLEKIAENLSAQFWRQYRDTILDTIDGSYLSGYDEADIREAFQSAATVSITYSIMARCGMQPENYFRHEDFLSIFDFNTFNTVAALGSAVSQCSEHILRQIEVTVKKYEREHSAERTAQHGEQTEVQAERGLPDSRPEAGRDGGPGHREVREDAEIVSETAQPDPVEHSGAERDAVSAPVGDRGRGEREAGTDDAGTGESSGSDGGTESQRPDALDRPDEHLQSAGGGSDPHGAGVRVNPEQGGEQFSLFPSEQQQIQYIAEAESVQAPSASGITQEEIDDLLRVGSNTDDARMKIVTEFSKGRTPDELTAFVKKTYHGGYGIQNGFFSLSAWYGENGIHLARGKSAEHSADALVLSWEDATARIGELLEQGRFATNVEIAEAPGRERHRLADDILYAIRDVSEEGREQGWDALYDSVSIRGNGFPEMSEYIAEILESPDKRKPFKERFRLFAEAWQENHAILRFRIYNPQNLLRRMDELELPRREYTSDMAELPTVRHFITEDEIDHVFSNAYQERREKVYLFWNEKHTAKEKADYLKRQYGIGGRNGAISGNFHSWIDHEGKGVKLRKPDCGEVHLSGSSALRVGMSGGRGEA